MRVYYLFFTGNVLFFRPLKPFNPSIRNLSNSTFFLLTLQTLHLDPFMAPAFLRACQSPSILSLRKQILKNLKHYARFKSISAIFYVIRESQRNIRYLLFDIDLPLFFTTVGLHWKQSLIPLPVNWREIRIYFLLHWSVILYRVLFSATRARVSA